MSVVLRPYQTLLSQQIDDAWAAGAANVLCVSECGSGKTIIFANKLASHNGYSCAIAHRQELVSQMSMTLCRSEIRHRIIAPKATVKMIIQLQIAEYGKDFYDPSSRIAVAGVNTLVNRKDDLKRWADQVSLWIIDESKHLLRDNQWGKAVAMFPNAKGLAVDATPERADGKGLGRHADGVVDVMIEGPKGRDLINGVPDNNGNITSYLTDYRIFCPPSNLDLSTIAHGADGDFIRGQLALKTKESTILGDVVQHYLRIAPGKSGVTFAPDIETSVEIANRFNDAGVPAEAVSAKTPDKLRAAIIRRFRKRELLQLVNCDLFGEGFDLPAIEVVSMARATESYALYHQQFMRGLRILEGKSISYVIDHVGNVLRHGLPDAPRTWSLDRRERRTGSAKDDDVIPMRVCLNPVCLSPYERVLSHCPLCGWIPVPAGRTSPVQVDGNLCELDPAILAAMRGEVVQVDKHPDQIFHMMQKTGHAYMIAKGAANRHAERQVAQTALRHAAELWMGYQRSMGRSINEAQRRWYFRWKVDILSAQSLGRADAEELTERVCLDLYNKLKGGRI
jgi:superfamily II DNA or RNA helicase